MTPIHNTEQERPWKKLHERLNVSTGLQIPKRHKVTSQKEEPERKPAGFGGKTCIVTYEDVEALGEGGIYGKEK